mmetsp:Transcript_9541/g.38980  ORF Transcript_9541/g.38980 Transcript_9541/m.38980 type:complete len:226 (+) Transcript_9541:993-1670(+)
MLPLLHAPDAVAVPRVVLAELLLRFRLSLKAKDRGLGVPHLDAVLDLRLEAYGAAVDVDLGESGAVGDEQYALVAEELCLDDPPGAAGAEVDFADLDGPCGLGRFGQGVNVVQLQLLHSLVLDYAQGFCRSVDGDSHYCRVTARGRDCLREGGGDRSDGCNGMRRARLHFASDSPEEICVLSEELFHAPHELWLFVAILGDLPRRGCTPGKEEACVLAVHVKEIE